MSGFHFLDKISKTAGESALQVCLRFYFGNALNWCNLSIIPVKLKASIHFDWPSLGSWIQRDVGFKSFVFCYELESRALALGNESIS
jgi:hypothetical protein